MSTSAVEHYQQVLADLRAKQAKIASAIEAIEEIMATLGVNSANTPAASSLAEIASDAFFGMSVADGARKLLQIAKKPLSTREVADSLEAGGIVHQSKDFYNTVWTVLQRSDVFSKLPDSKWGLSEWYKNSGRVKRVSLKPTTFTQSDIEGVASLSAPPEEIEDK